MVCVCEWGGIEQKEKEELRDTDNSVVMVRVVLENSNNKNNNKKG